MVMELSHPDTNQPLNLKRSARQTVTMKNVIRFEVLAAFTSICMLAACSKSETNTAGPEKPSMMDKLSGKADLLPDLQETTADGQLPPKIPGLMLAGKLNPALFEQQDYASFFLRSYNYPRRGAELEPGAESYKQMAAHAAKFPLEYAHRMQVGLGPYDPIRRGFPIVSGGDARLDGFRDEHTHFRQKYTSIFEIGFVKPIDLTFVASDKPSFCDGINCEAPDFKKTVQVAVSYRVESLEPFNPAKDLNGTVRISYRATPLKLALLDEDNSTAVGSGGLRTIAISNVSFSPMDWASKLSVSKSADGAYSLTSPEFVKRLALREIPPLRQNSDFVSNFGYDYMCDWYRHSGNEFEWPKKEPEFNAELERRVAETSVAQLVYTEHSVRLGQYNIEKAGFEFPHHSDAWTNVSTIELGRGGSSSNCPGSRGRGGMGFSVELAAAPAVTISFMPVEAAKAQAYVEKAESRGSREACLRLTWQLTGGERVGESSTLKLMAKPVRHELFDAMCTEKLGGASF